MKNLATSTTGNVFDDTELDEALIKEYYERNERKKADEAWLKKNGSLVKGIMAKQEKSKEGIGDYVVSVNIPDTSHFDNNKLLDYLLKEYPNLKDLYLKFAVDEEAVMGLIEDGTVDVEELKANAWVSSTGAPRLTINKIKKE
jgi:hypothetical protein